MKIIFWGTPNYSVETLKELLLSEHEIVAIITQPDKRRSRGKKLIPSAVKEFANKNNIDVLQPDKIKSNSTLTSKLKSMNCDLFIVIAYGRILPKEILEIPKYGSWNAHASLLPRWRGAAPIQWSLLSGDSFTGVGIMRMEEGLDTGDILMEKQLKIEDEDNLFTLNKKLSKLSSQLIIESLKVISKKVYDKKPFFLKPQSEYKREISYARMIQKEDLHINWDDDALNIKRKVNGLYPRSKTSYKNQNLKILKVAVYDEKLKKIINNEEKARSKFSSGTIIGIIEDEGILISTKTSPILLTEGKLEGKNTASKKRLIQQLKPKIGDKFLI